MLVLLHLACDAASAVVSAELLPCEDIVGGERLSMIAILKYTYELTSGSMVIEDMHILH
jgi:hypothetical protein